MNRTDLTFLAKLVYIWAALLVGLVYFVALDPGDIAGLAGFATGAVAHGVATTAAVATGGLRSPAYRLHAYLPVLALWMSGVLMLAALPPGMAALTASIPGLIVGNGVAYCQARRRERKAWVDAREAGRAALKIFRGAGDPTLN